MELSSHHPSEETHAEMRAQPPHPHRRYVRPAVVLELPLETRAGSVLGNPLDSYDPNDPDGVPQG